MRDRGRLVRGDRDQLGRLGRELAYGRAARSAKSSTTTLIWSKTSLAFAPAFEAASPALLPSPVPASAPDGVE
jgi:hypothetical protein